MISCPARCSARVRCQPDAYDPEQAKSCDEAGYPNSFTITIGSPNNRYINDAEVAQAIALRNGPRRREGERWRL